MTIYEIDQALLSLIDPDTGEIGDYGMFCELQMAKESKIENLALLIKNSRAEADAIKAEKDNLADREKSLRNKIERLRNYLSEILQGEKFSSPKVAISYRKSTAVEIADEAEFISRGPKEYLIPQPPKIDKKAISASLKAGKEIPGASLVERNNIQIK
jgi:hypothetical protein